MTATEQSDIKIILNKISKKELNLLNKFCIMLKFQGPPWWSIG